MTSFWNLFVAFSDPVSNAFLVLLEIVFLTRVRKTIFEKIDYMVIFRAAPGVLVARGTLKNGAVKNKNLRKSYFYPQRLLLGNALEK